MKSKKSINTIYAGIAMILGVFIAGELFGEPAKDSRTQSLG
jgi:hypothetical protein